MKSRESRGVSWSIYIHTFSRTWMTGLFDWETSVRMADLAARSGVFHMAATSHGNYYDYTLEEYRENF